MESKKLRLKENVKLKSSSSIALPKKQTKKARNETLALGLFKFNCSVPYVAVNSLVLVWFGLSLKIPTRIQTIEKFKVFQSSSETPSQ